MTIDKMKNIPDGILKTITYTTENGNGSNGLNHSQSVAPSPVGEVSQDEVFQAGISAQTNIINDNTEAPKPNADPKTPISTTNTGSKPISIGTLVGGKFATELMDTLFPALVILAIEAIGYTTDKKSLHLNEKEKNLLIPAMQDWLNSLNINFNNPFYNLLFVLGTIYTAKFVDNRDKIQSIKTKKPIVKADEITEQAEKALEKLNAKKEETKKREFTIDALKKMDKTTAIAFINEKRKKGIAEATTWYNKNVK